MWTIWRRMNTFNIPIAITSITFTQLIHFRWPMICSTHNYLSFLRIVLFDARKRNPETPENWSNQFYCLLLKWNKKRKDFAIEDLFVKGKWKIAKNEIIFILLENGLKLNETKFRICFWIFRRMKIKSLATVKFLDNKKQKAQADIRIIRLLWY